jgi:dihydroneopterin aldolase
MGQLLLENMDFYAFHGHFSEEQKIGGRFRVDLEIQTSLIRASETDKLEDTIDYSRVFEVVKNEMEIPSQLMEHLAIRIIRAVYSVSDQITSVTAKVSKLNPAIGGQMEKFSVVITR